MAKLVAGRAPDGSLILAQAPVMPQATPAASPDPGVTARASKPKEPKPPKGMPSLDVKPDVDAIPGLKVGSQVINGLGALALILLAVCGVVSVIAIATGKVGGFSHWAERGKEGLVLTVVGAFALGLIGALVYWGFSAGASG